jgi:ferrous iron transport protein A
MTIRDLKPGETAVVSGFSGDLRLQSRLVEMGILPGVAIRLIKRAPWNGPVELKVRDYYVTLRREDAGAVEVKVS